MAFEKVRKNVSGQELEVDADLWFKIWQELHDLVKKRGILVEVAHVKAHRSKKEKKMTQFERFVTEGNEKADELAKAGAMMDEGFYGRSES